MDKCHVCGAAIVPDRDYMDHVLMEEHVECPNGCYAYDYVTGYTEIVVGDFLWSYSYRDEFGSPTPSGLWNAAILARARYRDDPGCFRRLSVTEER